MARMQEFDTARALADARQVFWDKGFEAASITDLEAATGLSRSSIYNGFGSKRGLFGAVIEDYMDIVLRPRLAVLHQPAQQNGGIGPYLQSLATALARSVKQESNRGCLLLNTTAGIAGNDETLRALIDEYQIELRNGVAQALRVADGSLTEAKIMARARIIAGLAMSALLISRINLPEALSTLEAAGQQVNEWAAA